MTTGDDKSRMNEHTSVCFESNTGLWGVWKGKDCVAFSYCVRYSQFSMRSSRLSRMLRNGEYQNQLDLKMSDAVQSNAIADGLMGLTFDCYENGEKNETPRSSDRFCFCERRKRKGDEFFDFLPSVNLLFW
mmetsp:Transcript_17307/g.28014  ORF Transcript_17307/g.28014 Transcript_17307/m.28014 type:complete len:131 (+) Transcript_17307:1118-1510(+)